MAKQRVGAPAPTLVNVQANPYPEGNRMAKQRVGAPARTLVNVQANPYPEGIRMVKRRVGAPAPTLVWGGHRNVSRRDSGLDLRPDPPFVFRTLSG